AEVAHALAHGIYRRRSRTDAGVQPPDDWSLPGWLRLGGERRGEEHRTRAREERAAVHYWITSSARPSTDGGMVRPSALAVLRLIASSNLLGRSTGNSPALAPLRILST